MKKILAAMVLGSSVCLLTACSQASGPVGNDTSQTGQKKPAGTVMLDIKYDDGKMPTTVGKVVAGKGLESTGAAGQLMFGPYAAMDAGTYKVILQGDFDGAQPAAPLNVDVAYGQGVTVVKSIDVAPGDTQNGTLASFDFTLPTKVTDLEIRAKVAAGAHVVLKGYQVVVE